MHQYDRSTNTTHASAVPRLLIFARLSSSSSSLRRAMMPWSPRAWLPGWLHAPIARPHAPPQAHSPASIAWDRCGRSTRPTEAGPCALGRVVGLAKSVRARRWFSLHTPTAPLTHLRHPDATGHSRSRSRTEEGWRTPRRQRRRRPRRRRLPSRKVGPSSRCVRGLLVHMCSLHCVYAS